MDPSASLATLQDNCFSVLLITGMFSKALSFWAGVVEPGCCLPASAAAAFRQKPRANGGIPETQKAQKALQFHTKV